MLVASLRHLEPRLAPRPCRGADHGRGSTHTFTIGQLSSAELVDRAGQRPLQIFLWQLLAVPGQSGETRKGATGARSVGRPSLPVFVPLLVALKCGLLDRGEPPKTPCRHCSRPRPLPRALTIHTPGPSCEGKGKGLQREAVMDVIPPGVTPTGARRSSRHGQRGVQAPGDVPRIPSAYQGSAGPGRREDAQSLHTAARPPPRLAHPERQPQVWLGVEREFLSIYGSIGWRKEQRLLAKKLELPTHCLVSILCATPRESHAIQTRRRNHVRKSINCPGSARQGR